MSYFQHYYTSSARLVPPHPALQIPKTSASWTWKTWDCFLQLLMYSTWWESFHFKITNSCGSLSTLSVFTILLVFFPYAILFQNKIKVMDTKIMLNINTGTFKKLSKPNGNYPFERFLLKSSQKYHLGHTIKEYYKKTTWPYTHTELFHQKSQRILGIFWIHTGFIVL